MLCDSRHAVVIIFCLFTSKLEFGEYVRYENLITLNEIDKSLEWKWMEVRLCRFCVCAVCVLIIHKIAVISAEIHRTFAVKSKNI